MHQNQEARFLLGAEQSSYKGVEFGYCRPLPDPDQIMTYCLLRHTGIISADIPVNFLFASADAEQITDPQLGGRKIRKGDLL